MTSRSIHGFALAPELSLVKPTVDSPGPGPLQLLTDCHRRYGDYVAIEGDSDGPIYLLAHPDAIEHVLANHPDKYSKTENFRSIMFPLVGTGLLTSGGEEWLEQRRLMQPAFDLAQLDSFTQVIASCTWNLMVGWDQLPEGAEIDLHKDLVLLAETVGVELMFGSDQDPAASKLKDQLIETLYVLKHFLHLYAGGDSSSNVESRTRAANEKFNQLVIQLIERRLQGGERECGFQDFLSFVSGANNAAEKPSEQAILDQARTLLIVGHSNVASALTWCFYLLDRHSWAGDRIVHELDALRDSGATSSSDALSDPDTRARVLVTTFAALNSIPYTRLVLDESLRLYPPSWGAIRRLLVDDVINGRELSAGSLVFLSQWVTHRHPDFWERPEEFDPERFTPQRSADRHKFAYFPFGGGPRRCIARNLAQAEMLLVLTSILSNYEISLAADRGTIPIPSLSLMPAGGLPATIRRRS